jgi:hypothetical protein
MRGQLTIYLKVSWPPAFALPDEVLSILHLPGTPQDVIKSLLLEQTLSPAWTQFLSAFYKVVSQTVKLLDVHQFLLDLSCQWITNHDINPCSLTSRVKLLSQRSLLQPRLATSILRYNSICTEWPIGGDRSGNPG